MEKDDEILKRLKRRLGSARGSVVLEFALVAPLAIAVICFAADFTRILRTEQQLEIASRVMADIESHMVSYEKDSITPTEQAKYVGKYYLRDIAKVVEGTGNVLVKGGAETTRNLLSVAIADLNDILSGKFFDDSPVLNLLFKIVGTVANFLTFRTLDYLTNIAPRDREVRVTTTAVIPSILPNFCYSWWGSMSRNQSFIGVGQFAPDRKKPDSMVHAWSDDLNIVSNKRHRVYCHMPIIDTAPIAPQTYVRRVKSWFSKWL
ncbi:MAG: pilus assembly protein [Kiritimatiellae bacterium]|nr:pilus assembly protein [Kiritimatiellia bacterium]